MINIMLWCEQMGCCVKPTSSGKTVNYDTVATRQVTNSQITLCFFYGCLRHLKVSWRRLATDFWFGINI